MFLRREMSSTQTSSRRQVTASGATLRAGANGSPEIVPGLPRGGGLVPRQRLAYFVGRFPAPRPQDELVDRHRAPDVKALADVDAGFVEPVHLRQLFDAFRKDQTVGFLREMHDGLDDRLVVVRVGNSVDERFVDLDDVRIERGEIRERRVPRTEVIDRNLETALSQASDGVERQFR